MKTKSPSNMIAGENGVIVEKSMASVCEGDIRAFLPLRKSSPVSCCFQTDMEIAWTTVLGGHSHSHIDLHRAPGDGPRRRATLQGTLSTARRHSPSAPDRLIIVRREEESNSCAVSFLPSRLWISSNHDEGALLGSASRFHASLLLQ